MVATKESMIEDGWDVIAINNVEFYAQYDESDGLTMFAAPSGVLSDSDVAILTKVFGAPFETHTYKRNVSCVEFAIDNYKLNLFVAGEMVVDC